MYKQCELPYGYADLEPSIDAQTVEIHYTKHHAAYTSNLNKVVEEADLEKEDICKLLENLDEIKDPDICTRVKNNGGGFFNHNLYFKELGPGGKRMPDGELATKIDTCFGSFEKFKEEISKLALNQFGSGWAWMSVTPACELVICSTCNQDNPIINGTGNFPIFTIDVWEHAYYLKYKNMRADYVKNFFDVVNWEAVEKNYEKALEKFKKETLSDKSNNVSCHTKSDKKSNCGCDMKNKGV